MLDVIHKYCICWTCSRLNRCVSAEMHISGCYGSVIPGSDSCCVAMAALDWRTALAFEFTHNKSLDEAKGVAIQVGLMWSHLMYGLIYNHKSLYPLDVDIRHHRLLIQKKNNHSVVQLIFVIVFHSLCCHTVTPLERKGLGYTPLCCPLPINSSTPSEAARPRHSSHSTARKV